MTGTMAKIHHRLAASISVVAIVAPSAAGAALDDIVFIKGESSDSPIAFGQAQGEAGQVDMEDACRTANQYIFFGAAVTPPSVLRHIFGYEPAMGDLPSLDCSEAQPPDSRYLMMYSTCSMTMTDGVHTMRWTVPPGASEAQMVIVNAQTKEFIVGSLLETDLSQVADFAKGREIKQEVKRASGSREYEIELEIGPTGNYRTSTEAFTGQAYTVEYEGDIGLPGMREMGLPMSKLESKGTAWLAPDVPGSDVVAKFYENFKNHVTPATGAGTLFTAMIEQMADVVQNGMPLETKQTYKSSMPIGGFGGLADARAGQGSTTTSTIAAVTVWQGAASEHQVCGHLEVPEGYTQTSMTEMAGMSGGQSVPPEQMQELEEAMQQMTPEQREMMENMGVWNVLDRTKDGVVPGSQPTANPRASSKSAGSAMPPSEQLQGDSLAESVQKHLQALGYDVGNTNGEMSIETTIAISTFQAEKGMEVTGEVTPQLLGVLSAEVDSRR